MRRFVEHLVAEGSSTVITSGLTRKQVDWGALEAAVAESNSIEQAIGRAVALADRMCRGDSGERQLTVTTSAEKADQPFFAFSVADVVPDFGDDSRYRTRVAKRVARIFANRRQPASDAGAGTLITSEP